MSKKVAFITGASRGIGAESAVALAKAGYQVAITARTLSEGESHDHVGNSTPVALVKTLLPDMLKRQRGTIINMVSYTAFNNPPAPADKGGWGFAYPSSKAAFGRMAGSLRAEHSGSGLRCFNLEPGTVVTEVMKAAGITDDVMKRFKPCTLAAIAKRLDLLRAPSLLEN